MKMPQLRVALVSSSYHPHFGGVEEHVRHVARELQSRGHAVEVWTVDRGDGLRDEVVDGCRVRYLPTPLPARSARALGSLALRAPRAVASWLRAYVAFRPDVVHIQCFGPNGIYGQALASLTRTPLVISSHGETFGDEHGIFAKSALLRARLRRAVNAGTVTGCSPLVAEDLRTRFGASAVHVVPNGVDLADPTIPADPGGRPVQTTSPSADESSAPVLIGVGRLVPQKGFDILLEAAARSKHEPQVWIVGEGAERPRLGRMARELGIIERVHLLGRRPANEIQTLMSAATAVVVPSRAEAFGIVVLEAWASGTPVLATSRGGPAGFVTHDHDGLLIDPLDLPSVVDSIDRVLGDAPLASRLADAGATTVRSYTWARVTDAYCEIYAAVVPRD